MPGDSEHTSVVAWMDTPNSNDDNSTTPWTASVISLVHPSTGEMQHFIYSQNDIYEMQSISRKYGSFFVGSRVISNGALHVMTRIDPLFFLLQELTTNKGGHQWQPLDQLQVPSHVQDAISDEHQWNHVCAVKTLDDLVLYKFQTTKALAWLVKKQQAAYTVVSQQMLNSKRNQKQATEKLMSEGGGAYSNTFRLAQDENKVNDMDTFTPGETSQLTNMERAEAKEASVEIVCEYLSAEWQLKLRTHLNMTVSPESEENQSDGKKRRASWEANPGQNDADQLLQFTMGTGASTKEESSTNKKSPPKTAGLKRLAKVNTKGMKSLANFFGAKKKKTTNGKV